MAKRGRGSFSKELLAAAFSELGKRGGRARAESLSPKERAKIARMGGAATRAKWAKVRKAKMKAGTP